MRLFSTVLLLCLGLIARPAQASGFPVTIDNCGTPEIFAAAPEHAVSNDANNTSTMFALGLQSRMAGVSGIGGLNKFTSELRARLGTLPELSQNYPPLEALIGAHADFYFAGWNYGMTLGGPLTPENLGRFGIKTYAIRESCIHLGPRAPIGLEDMYRDVLSIGQIFGVAERAEALVVSFKERVAAVEAAVAGTTAPRVFVYDSMEDAPETAGKFAMPTALIAAAGGRNITDDVAGSWTKVSWETVTQRDPQFIAIVDYAPVSAEEKIGFLEHHPALATIDAVKNKRFIVLPYEAATPGVRNIDAIEALARAFHPERFP
jgi:iron complex transport system substrate-binding protein